MYTNSTNGNDKVTMSDYTLNFLAQGLSDANVLDQQTYARVMFDTMTQGQIEGEDYQFIVDQLLSMMEQFSVDLNECLHLGDFASVQRMITQLNNINTALTEIRAIPMYTNTHIETAEFNAPVVYVRNAILDNMSQGDRDELLKLDHSQLDLLLTELRNISAREKQNQDK